ncbi:hypothetical protein PVK06_024431 [Gossypium arboreum]|uniref:Uncharacterized protein n=1 Tax=Gossypium arboreum TaxID=29729 RepID=A0ABR0PDX3_GOSAR|nr:hypothetical protein PVK06_024431 [Gossypium arboreum]
MRLYLHSEPSDDISCFLLNDMLVVVMEEVIQIDAAMTTHHPEVPGLVSYRRLLQEDVNPWQRGCSKLTRCRN